VISEEAPNRERRGRTGTDFRGRREGEKPFKLMKNSKLLKSSKGEVIQKKGKRTGVFGANAYGLPAKSTSVKEF